MSAATTEAIELTTSGGTGGRNAAGGDGHGGGSGDGGGSGREDRGPSSAGVPQRTYVTGMTIALCAIVMFFMALVSAYVVGMGFPGSGSNSFSLPRILWLNTLILIASSFAITHSRRRFLKGDRGGFRHWWAVTVALGLLFVAGQLIAWRELVAEGVYLSSNPSSSFFYVITAAHGLHILGGVAALAFLGFGATRRLTRATAIEISALYWHFMDGIWAFLFVVLMFFK